MSGRRVPATSPKPPVTEHRRRDTRVGILWAMTRVQIVLPLCSKKEQRTPISGLHFLHRGCLKEDFVGKAARAHTDTHLASQECSAGVARVQSICCCTALPEGRPDDVVRWRW